MAIRHPGALRRLYRLIAQHTSDVFGPAALAEPLSLSRNTARAYLDLLIHVHLVRELPGWTVGVSAKASRRPKIHVADTGLAAAAIGADAARLARSTLARMLEACAFSETVSAAASIPASSSTPGR